MVLSLKGVQAYFADTSVSDETCVPVSGYRFHYAFLRYAVKRLFLVSLTTRITSGCAYSFHDNRQCSPREAYLTASASRAKPFAESGSRDSLQADRVHPSMDDLALCKLGDNWCNFQPMNCCSQETQGEDGIGLAA